MGAPLLEIEELRTHFFTTQGTARAVDSLSLRVEEGEVVGLVGESGCGKSVTALSVLRLLPSPPAKIVGGRIVYRGQDLLLLPEKEMIRVRGNEISMVFQEPMTSLNPVLTVGAQVEEGLLRHRGLSARAARRAAVEMLREVGIANAEARTSDYPHRLSGGMRQRVLLAIALACRPSLLIADEPTTALDVTIQAQILDLLRRLMHRFEMALLLITHDLGVVAEMADRVAVMYAGEIVEEGPVGAIYSSPSHPYTEALLRSLPRPDDRFAPPRPIGGTVPDPYDYPTGCRFHQRCPIAVALCRQRHPAFPPGKPRCLLRNGEVS
jgi:oligopeptide/dipeptide ABC transporter ATP-binding protein